MVVKKTKTDPAGGILLLIASFLGAIILLASFLAVFVLIGVWVYFERAIKRYPGILSQIDIQLSKEEKQELNDCIDAKARIQRRLLEIEDRKQDLLVRKDGSFDSRNREGRTLNTEMESLRGDLSACNKTIFRLEMWERDFYSEWVTNKSGLFASRAALASLPASISVFLFYRPALLLSLSGLIERQINLLSFGQIKGFYGALVFGVWTSIAIFLFLWTLSFMVAPKFRNT